MVQESRPASGTGVGDTPVLAAHEDPRHAAGFDDARLDRMESEQEVAQLAATLGREFSYELLSAVVPIDAASLQAELDKLVGAEILFQKGRPPRCTYAFRHALLEDALYNSLVKSKRQEFHQRVAEGSKPHFRRPPSLPELLGTISPRRA